MPAESMGTAWCWLPRPVWPTTPEPTRPGPQRHCVAVPRLRPYCTGSYVTAFPPGAQN